MAWRAVLATALALLPPLVARASGQRPPEFRGRTVVVAGRAAESAAEAGRREVVLTREEIARLPARTVTEVLALVPGLGVMRRGAPGAQADLGIRGATFEQVQILVNGVPLTSPQTGHFALDLWIPLDAVERIEILYGPGSAARGAGAFGGAVNIVTGVRVAAARAEAGQYGLAAGGGAAPVGGGPWVAAERLVHTGFREDTEVDLGRVAGGWSWAGRRSAWEVVAAAGKRRFGAWSFYSARFPDEWERTSGGLVVVRGTVLANGVELRPYVRLDRHRDLFVLDRRRPQWYRNRHETRTGSAGVALAGGRSRLRWAVGAEFGREEIDSSNLGRHHRVRSGGYAEVKHRRGAVTVDLQARVDHESTWGTVASLAAGGSWRFGSTTMLLFHYGQSFRPPSFTELYYRSPSTAGDPHLAPERGRTVEVGVESGNLSLTVFRRRAHPLIDFVLGDDGVWRAANLGGVVTRGMEASVMLPALGPLRRQRLGVTWLRSSLHLAPGRSRYALAHPRLEAVWTGDTDLGAGWSAGWGVRFRDPRGAGSWATLDLRLARRILRNVDVALVARNVCDREVTELSGIPLPGRWVSVRLSWRGDS